MVGPRVSNCLNVVRGMHALASVIRSLNWAEKYLGVEETVELAQHTGEGHHVVGQTDGVGDPVKRGGQREGGEQSKYAGQTGESGEDNNNTHAPALPVPHSHCAVPSAWLAWLPPPPVLGCRPG